MPYDLDLERLSLGEYRAILKGRDLLPGRRILWQDIDEHFAALEGRGVRTVAQLKRSLSTPAKIAALAKGCAIPEDYLVILKREIGSLEGKPVLLSSFPGVDSVLIESLNAAGIKSSRDYFESSPGAPGELLCLCDLVRINGVGAIAARAFYEAGYRSVSDVARADAAPMLERVSEVNRTRGYFKAKLGVKDMQFCIDCAALLLRLGS